MIVSEVNLRKSRSPRFFMFKKRFIKLFFRFYKFKRYSDK